MVTPLSGLFPTEGEGGVACLLFTGPGKLGFSYPHWTREGDFTVTPHWAREFVYVNFLIKIEERRKRKYKKRRRKRTKEREN